MIGGGYQGIIFYLPYYHSKLVLLTSVEQNIYFGNQTTLDPVDFYCIDKNKLEYILALQKKVIQVWNDIKVIHLQNSNFGVERPF